MIFAPSYSRDERSVIAGLHLVGLDGERSVRPREEFRRELRDRLVAEAAGSDRCCRQDLALAGC